MDKDPTLPIPASQPALALGVLHDPDGQVELVDPGPSDPEPDPGPVIKGSADDKTIPMWPCLGYAPGADWRRDEKGGRPSLKPLQLLLAIQSVDKHAGHPRKNGRVWLPVDGATMAELQARCWGVAELSSMHFTQTPRWLEKLCYSAPDASGRVWSRPRWLKILSAIVAAYRSGALGLRLSLEELAAEFNMSRSTAGRCVAAMRKLGLVRVLRIWTTDNGSRERERRHNVYQLGDVAEAEAGPAILAGCRPALRGKVRASTVTRCAHALRARGRAFRRARQCDAWQRHDVSRRLTAAQRRSVAGPVPRRPPGPVDLRPQGQQDRVRSRGSVKLHPQPSSPSGSQIHRPGGPAGNRSGYAVPTERKRLAAADAAPAPIPPDAGGKQPATNATAGPAGLALDGASGGPTRDAGAQEPAGEGWLFAVDLEKLAPNFAAGASAQVRMALGANVNPCPGCRGTGQARLSGGVRYRCAACGGSGERTPRATDRADA